MTRRELINNLLDCNMDKPVKLYLPEPSIDDNGELFEGFVFDIESAKNNTIIFQDWRKPRNTEKEKEKGKGQWNEQNNTIICSRCNTWFPKERKEFMLYCPYCGAEMKGSEE